MLLSNNPFSLAGLPLQKIKYIALSTHHIPVSANVKNSVKTKNKLFIKILLWLLPNCYSIYYYYNYDDDWKWDHWFWPKSFGELAFQLNFFFLFTQCYWTWEDCKLILQKWGFACACLICGNNTFYIFERHARRFREGGDLFVQFVSHWVGFSSLHPHSISRSLDTNAQYAYAMQEWLAMYNKPHSSWWLRSMDR